LQPEAVDFRRRNQQRREPAAGDDAEFSRLLDRIDGVLAGVGKGDNLGFGALRLQQKDEKSEVLSW
jgi:hypothetical protein